MDLTTKEMLIIHDSLSTKINKLLALHEQALIDNNKDLLHELFLQIIDSNNIVKEIEKELGYGDTNTRESKCNADQFGPQQRRGQRAA